MGLLRPGTCVATLLTFPHIWFSSTVLYFEHWRHLLRCPSHRVFVFFFLLERVRVQIFLALPAIWALS